VLSRTVFEIFDDLLPFKKAVEKIDEIYPENFCSFS